MIDQRDLTEIPREDELLVRRTKVGILIVLPIITVGVAMVVGPGKPGLRNFWMMFAHMLLAVHGPFVLLGATAIFGIVVAKRQRKRDPIRSKLVFVPSLAVLLWSMLQLANHADFFRFEAVHLWRYPSSWFLFQVAMVAFVLIANHDSEKEEKEGPS